MIAGVLMAAIIVGWGPFVYMLQFRRRTWWALRRAWKRLRGDRVDEWCKVCGADVPIVWHAHTALWCRVTGEDDDVSGGTFCPTCFDAAAEARGLSLRWEPSCR